MDDLTAFVTRMLDEDEAMAKAATPGPWRWGDWQADFGTPEQYRNTLEHSPAHGDFPASKRVRDADSTLVVLRLEDALEYDEDQERNGAHIARHDPARVLREVAALRWLATFVDVGGSVKALRQIAAIWDGHPGYRDEWRP